MSEKAIRERRKVNDDKPPNNLCKISCWVQITILLFLDEKDIIK